MSNRRRPPVPTRDGLREEYLALWHTLEVRPERQAAVDRAARLVLAFRDRYEAVAQACGRVPWWLVGIVHVLEAGGRFDRHLHNGDPLTHPTRQVPAGRPRLVGGPFEFEESAVDALRLKGWHNITRWDLPRIAFELERYNGWGYRQWHPDVLSPYLWSFTVHYRSGKYIADGRWSASAVSAQAGAMAILRALADLDDAVAATLRETPSADPATDHRRTPESADGAPDRAPPESMAQSTTGNTALAVGGGAGVPQVGMAASEAAARSSTGQEFLLALCASPLFWTGVVAIVGAAYIWFERRRRLRQFGV